MTNYPLTRALLAHAREEIDGFLGGDEQLLDQIDVAGAAGGRVEALELAGRLAMLTDLLKATSEGFRAERLKHTGRRPTRRS